MSWMCMRSVARVELLMLRAEARMKDATMMWQCARIRGAARVELLMLRAEAGMRRAARAGPQSRLAQMRESVVIARRGAARAAEKRSAERQGHMRAPSMAAPYRAAGC